MITNFRIFPGDTIRVEVGFTQVTGEVTSVDCTRTIREGGDPVFDLYSVELRNEETGLPHYWKPDSDGGRIDWVIYAEPVCPNCWIRVPYSAETNIATCPGCGLTGYIPDFIFGLR